jgi:predicted ATPase
MLAGRYRDGAWFVSFADVTDPDLIASTICRALELADQPGVEPESRLKAWLSEREVLLVLDNLEQLADGTTVLGDLLVGCPGLVLLVTSREPLHLVGERQYDVPVLILAEAIELFATRAEAAAPRLSVPVDLARRICERLDCLPLAVELAAARAKAVSPAELLARLDTSLTLLTGGPRDAPQRQRTLRATIDWSYELLTHDEQQLFSRLAVFAGGWTLPAAAAICGAGIDAMQALVDRSLVRADGGRYWLPQTVREYALERFERTTEYDAVHQAHARWFVELVEHEGLAPPGWPHRPSQRAVAAEGENFRIALAWASAAGRFETMARLAAPLVGVWVVTGQLHEASRWMTLVLEHRDQYSGRLVAQVLSAAQGLARQRGEYGEAASLGEQALAIWEELGDRAAVGNELVSLGFIAVLRGDRVGGRAVLERAIGYARKNTLTDALPRALNNLGVLAIYEGKLAEARLLCEECVAVSAPASLLAGMALINLSYVATLSGRHADGGHLAGEALQAAIATGDRLTAASAAIHIAWPLAEQGELRQSSRLLGAGLAFLETSGADRDWMDEACEAAVRRILTDSLDPETANALLDEGLALSLEEAVRGTPGG